MPTSAERGICGSSEQRSSVRIDIVVASGTKLILDGFGDFGRSKSSGEGRNAAGFKLRRQPFGGYDWSGSWAILVAGETSRS